MREERTPSHLSAPSANRLRWAVSLLLATMFALLVLFRTGHMWLRYEAALADYQRRAESLSLVLSKHLEQTIAAADTALAKLALQSERIGGPNALSLSWSPVLEAASSGLYGVSSISLINENGLVTQSSRLAAVGESRAEEFLFRRMAKVPTAELIVDLPSRSVVDGKPTIQMGRRLVDSEGFLQVSSLQRWSRNTCETSTGRSIPDCGGSSGCSIRAASCCCASLPAGSQAAMLCPIIRC